MSEGKDGGAAGATSTEVKEAIRIADKHLAGASIDRRMALAKDIVESMVKVGGEIAREAIAIAFEGTRETELPEPAMLASRSGEG